RLDDDARHTDTLVRLLGQLERDFTMRAPDMVLQAGLSVDTVGLPAATRSLPLAIAVESPPYAHDALRLRIVRAAGTTPGLWQNIEWWHEDGVLWRAAGAPAVQYPLPPPEAP